MNIDRIAPTVHPNLQPDGYQGWDELLFVHWSFAPEIVQPLLPPELELDLHDGNAWVGLVPFIMRDIRPAWLPSFAAFNFLETNLRTYVIHDGKPGVFFFSLEASSWLAVHAARTQWRLPYFYAEMSRNRRGAEIEYRTIRKDAKQSHLHVKYEIGELYGPATPGTFEHFLLERYYLFVKKNETIYRGQVHHTPYPAQAARVLELDESLLTAAGLPAPNRPPDTAHFAAGVDVEVFGPWPIHLKSE